MNFETKKYLEDTKLSIALFLFLFLLYAIVYMTKTMFTSAMAIIVEEGFMTKSQTGLINAVFWLVYAPFSQSFAAFHFGNYGRIGTVTGILNATASIGNVLASYVFAKMAELMPWRSVTASWLITIVACGLLCAAVLPRWTRFTKE